MKSSHRVTTTLAILAVVTAVAAIGQSPPDGDRVNVRSGVLQSGYPSERYFGDEPAEDRRSRQFPPATGSDADDFPGLPTNWLELSSDLDADGTLPNSLLHRSPEILDPQSQGIVPVRDRISLISNSRNRSADGPILGDRDRGNMGDLREGDFRRDNQPGLDGARRLPLGYHEHEYLPREIQSPFRPDPLSERENLPIDPSDDTITSGDHDPFIPAPAPDNRPDSERSKMDEIISIRYQNPVTVRAIRAMSSSQAVDLYSEVNQKIDERCLEPTSYDVRMRRALRNLMIALDNAAFLNGLELPVNSFQLDGFRNTLARLADSGPFRDYGDSLSVLRTVISHAQVVKGLTPGAVGFEFANASVDTLDEYSGLDPTDPALRSGAVKSSQQNDVLEEEIVGIGLEVREHADGLIVVKPVRGGPAADAGVEPGDVILNIDDRDIRGMKIGRSMDLLRGPRGSQMKLRVNRNGSSARDLVLTRRRVRVWTVNDARILSGTDIGYFSLSRFSRNSTTEVDQALESLHIQGMKSLIIDLRGNPGGLLTTSVEISDRFVACGIIVSTRGRLSSDNMIEEATYSKTWNVPMAVLVDGDSASGSEIFAAAIQENKRGVIVGTRTYGKGAVQTHFPLSSIEGDLRLTTAMFYSPTGRRMAGRGVMPDAEVIDRDGIRNGDDVLEEAVRIAQGPNLSELAESAGDCRQRKSSAIRSSLLDDIVDPSHPGTIVL